MSLAFDPATVEPRDLADRRPCPFCDGNGRLARIGCDDCMGLGYALTPDESRAVWLARDADRHGF